MYHSLDHLISTNINPIFLDVSCENRHIRICLQPRSPQLMSSLSSGRSNAYIASETSLTLTDVQCALRQIQLNPTNGMPQWCTLMTWSHAQTACGAETWYDTAVRVE